jgi:hypothetical protein
MLKTEVIFSFEKPVSVILGFRRDVDEICALLGCYVASSDNPLLTFRDNVSAPILRCQEFQEDFLTLED